jgi:signal peptidase I
VILVLLCGFGSAVGFAFVLQERVIQAFVIPSESMAPTINHGDRILTLKEVFLDRDPERGELVILRNPEQRRIRWVKRVIVIAGDHIEWRDNGEVLVNNTPLAHTPTDTEDVHEENEERRYMIRLSTGANDSTSSGSMVVPQHHCFVMGDNRFKSRDSRHLGPIAYNGLIATPVAKIWGGFGKLE